MIENDYVLENMIVRFMDEEAVEYYIMPLLPIKGKKINVSARQCDFSRRKQL